LLHVYHRSAVPLWAASSTPSCLAPAACCSSCSRCVGAALARVGLGERVSGWLAPAVVGSMELGHAPGVQVQRNV